DAIVRPELVREARVALKALAARRVADLDPRYRPPHMVEAKTKPTTTSAAQFIARVPDPARRADAESLVQIFQRATGEPPVMWGPSIVGFGAYHYTYESGREGDMCLVGFSPRSTSLVLYARSGAKGEEARLAKLGKYKSSTGCLYVKRLADIDAKVLEQLVRASAAHTKKEHAPKRKKAK
ncbi:MAG: DUF1801 domain-containing protein, partial [Kofleriaceae bacterium]